MFQLYRGGVLLVEETGVPGKNHRPVSSHWKTLSHNVISNTLRQDRGSNELTTLVVIGTDCTGGCKSNYHTITSTTTPSVIYEWITNNWIIYEWVYSFVLRIYMNGYGFTPNEYMNGVYFFKLQRNHRIQFYLKGTVQVSWVIFLKVLFLRWKLINTFKTWI